MHWERLLVWAIERVRNQERVTNLWRSLVRVQQYHEEYQDAPGNEAIRILRQVVEHATEYCGKDDIADDCRVGCRKVAT
jgi:hypothetical protein